MSKIQERFISLSPRKVISIDFGPHSLKAVLVKKKGNKAVISSCVEIDRTSDDISHDLDRLLEGEELRSGYAIMVTDQVRFLASELSIPTGKKLAEDKLVAAAAWEMEPYLDFPVSEGLFACQLQEHKTSGDTTPVLISAVDGKTYSRFSKMLKDYRLSLHRAYSPEGAFAFSSYLPEEGKNKIVIDCRKDFVRSIFLLATGPFVFQNLPGDVGNVKDFVREVIHDLMASAGKAEEIVVAGDGASEDLIGELKSEFENIRLWGTADAPVTIELAADLPGFGSQYAPAVGAALQELKLAGKAPLGVTDRVLFTKSLARKIKEDRRLLPATILALFFLSISGHYAIIKTSTSRYTAEIKALQGEKKRLLIPIEKKRKLEDKIRDIRQKREYLEKTLPACQKNLLALLQGISHLCLPDMVLERLSQQDDGSFTIEGSAFQGRSVAYFNQRLSALKSCEKSSIKTLHNEESRQEELFPYYFVIKLRFKQE